MAFTDDSAKLLVAVKAYARGNALPLDNSEVYGSKAEAKSYAASATAYAGQTIKVLENGKYVSYVLDPKAEGGFSLTRVGLDESVATDLDDLKQKVLINEANIVGNAEEIETINSLAKQNALDIAAEIERATGIEATLRTDVNTVKNDYLTSTDKTALTKEISNAEARARTHADNAVAALVDSAPETLDTLNELAQAITANQDVIDTLNESITKKADKTTVEALQQTVTNNKTELDIAIEALQGKATALESKDTEILADIAELETAINNNAQAIADEKSRAEGIETELQAAIDTLGGDLTDAVSEINAALETKAAATDLVTLTGRVTTAEQTLNTKVNTSTLNSEIAELEQAIASKTDMASVESYVEGRLGIDENTTVKTYINNAIGSGGVASAEAIAKAKTEAIAESKDYTNTQLSWVSYNSD